MVFEQAAVFVLEIVSRVAFHKQLTRETKQQLQNKKHAAEYVMQ